MLTTENVIFMLAIPLGFAGIIGLVLLSGSLSPERRRWIEGLMMAVFYPGMALFFLYRATGELAERDWLVGAAQLGLAVVMAGQGIVMLGKRRRADGTRS